MKDKPIVIAGNGPSLAHIDYRRLPADFDVFRCNQFYFEEKYFLGRKVTGVFLNPSVIKNQYFTLRTLSEKNEYQIEEKYCACMNATWEGEENFPTLKNTFFFLQSMPQFHELQRFLWVYHRQSFTSTINMLITALAQGYKEIYLVGLDFYEGGGAKYAFDSNKKNLVKCLPALGNENFVDPTHSKDIDIMGLRLAQAVPGVKLYSLSEGSILANYVDLAPIVNKNPMQIENKAPDALKDFADLPHFCTDFGPVRKFVEKHDLWPEYEKLKDNIYMQALYDLIKLIKIIPLVLKKIFFHPRRKKTQICADYQENRKEKRENL